MNKNPSYKREWATTPTATNVDEEQDDELTKEEGVDHSKGLWVLQASQFSTHCRIGLWISTVPLCLANKGDSMVIRKKKYQDEYCVHGLETITKTDLLLNVMKERNPIAVCRQETWRNGIELFNLVYTDSFLLVQTRLFSVAKE